MISFALIGLVINNEIRYTLGKPIKQQNVRFSLLILIVTMNSLKYSVFVRTVSSS